MPQPQTDQVDLREKKCLVATVVLTGLVEEAYAEQFANMRSWNDRNGFHAVEYRTFPGTLVEAARDAVALHAIQNKYDAILQIDADAAPFPPDSLARMLFNGYVAVPDADAIGAYCQLKGRPLPTIDTGTGTWEVHYPGKGVIPVIRTGAHFLFTKTSAFQKFGPPWFRTRRVMHPVDALKEVDNLARCHLDGENPFTKTEYWDTLVGHAKQKGEAQDTVGEDSGFCDNLKANNGVIYVDTDLVAGHVSRKIIMPRDLKEMDGEQREKVRLCCGIME